MIASDVMTAVVFSTLADVASAGDAESLTIRIGSVLVIVGAIVGATWRIRGYMDTQATRMSAMEEAIKNLPCCLHGNGCKPMDLERRMD